jgi:hypothetical protein
MRSQIAAIFATALLVIIPAAVLRHGDPVSLQGAGLIGALPRHHFRRSPRHLLQGLGFPDLWSQILALAAAIPIC